MHEGPVVVFSGGGTGGHLYPALAIADELRAHRPDVRAFFVGAQRGLEARVLPERGEEHLLVPLRGIDRAKLLGNWRVVTGLGVGLLRVFRLFTEIRPEVVVVTGGYAGAAAGIAAGLMGIPLVLQEQNSYPGAVSKLLTRWATRIHVAYPEAIDRLPLAGSVRLSGNPVRSPAAKSREAARAEFGLPVDGRVVLVVGGSQGSVALNGAVLDLVEAVGEGTVELPADVRLLWATGPKHFSGVTESLERMGRPAWLHAFSYFEEMPSALACADVAVSRAGAMSTAELLNQGLPAVLVPLPTAAEDHQMHNARALAEAGAAVLVPQQELTPARLAEEVHRLFEGEGVLEEMRARALGRARPDAKSDIAVDVAALLSSTGQAA